MATTLGDISSAIEVAPGGSLCLARRAAPGFSGYVQVVFVRSDAVVRVEYEISGLEEGGVYFEGRYDTVTSAVRAVAAFLGHRVDDLPIYGDIPDRKGGEEKSGSEGLKRALRAGAVPLPEGTRFTLKSSYWRQFLPPPSDG